MPTPIVSPSHLSTDALFTVSPNARCSSTRIPAASVLYHQDAVENTKPILLLFIFLSFPHSCIPGNAEGLRNHIPNAPAAAVTLLCVKEQACPQHHRSGLQSVPAEPQTRQGMGGSRDGEEGRVSRAGIWRIDSYSNWEIRKVA